MLLIYTVFHLLSKHLWKVPKFSCTCFILKIFVIRLDFKFICVFMSRHFFPSHLRSFLIFYYKINQLRVKTPQKWFSSTVKDIRYIIYIMTDSILISLNCTKSVCMKEREFRACVEMYLSACQTQMQHKPWHMHAEMRSINCIYAQHMSTHWGDGPAGKKSQDHTIFNHFNNVYIHNSGFRAPDVFFFVLFFFVNAFSRSVFCLQSAKDTVQIDESKHAVKAAQKLLKREKCKTL